MPEQMIELIQANMRLISAVVCSGFLYLNTTSVVTFKRKDQIRQKGDEYYECIKFSQPL